LQEQVKVSEEQHLMPLLRLEQQLLELPPKA
jgi:hypothetical protein